MSSSQTEDLIRQRFDELVDVAWLPTDVAEDDSQMAVVVSVLRGWVSGKCRVLDCGCAKGRMLKKLPGNAEAVGLDLSGELLHAARGNGVAGLVQGSASALPFATGSFDFVYCIETLEHLPDTQSAIDEMARVLRPGGVLLVIDKNLYSVWPYFPYLPTFLYKFLLERRNKWMYPSDFPFRERYFSKWEFTSRLRRAGLQEARCRYLATNRIKLYRWLPFLSLDLVATARK